MGHANNPQPVLDSAAVDRQKSGLSLLLRGFPGTRPRPRPCLSARPETERPAKDVSEDVAWEVLKRVSSQGLALPASPRSFCEFMLDYGKLRSPRMPGFSWSP